MIRTSIAAAALILLTTICPAFAGQNENAAQSTAGAPRLQRDGASNRLMIVNGNTGHVIYDDGRDDLFCVTRRYFVGWYYDGRRAYRRTMSCR